MAGNASCLFLIFNHDLTPVQREAARRELGVVRFEPLPPHLARRWGQIPPDLAELSPFLAPFREWLAQQARPGDLVLIQGDPGAVCLMVDHARQQGLTPVYATTRRVSREEPQPDGSVRTQRVFEHQRFRRYGD
ncbi:MAG: hypothetical protein FJ128_08930 [Deltaproteobacteria bacterium]|nr:hypothetical protein [Deltaproteobacteria bacterium]